MVKCVRGMLQSKRARKAAARAVTWRRQGPTERFSIRCALLGILFGASGGTRHRQRLVGCAWQLRNVPEHVLGDAAVDAQRQVAALVHDLEVGGRRSLLPEGTSLGRSRARRAGGDVAGGLGTHWIARAWQHVDGRLGRMASAEATNAASRATSSSTATCDILGRRSRGPSHLAPVGSDGEKIIGG